MKIVTECECVTISGEDADEEEEGGGRGKNCEPAIATAKEEETNRKDTSSSTKAIDDTIKIGDDTISRGGMDRIKEEGKDVKGDDGKGRAERSLQWFYQAILKSKV